MVGRCIVKLGCVCGHVISDITDNLPYKASFRLDVDEDAFYEKIMEGFRSFLQAIREDRRNEWLKEWCSESGYEGYVRLNLSDEDVFHDFLSGLLISCERTIYQCTECGRIHIELEDNTFYRFQAEDGQVHLMFDKKRLE